jgi:hypothetical protein
MLRIPKIDKYIDLNEIGDLYQKCKRLNLS